MAYYSCIDWSRINVLWILPLLVLILRKIARTLLLAITTIVFVFALVSGSESYGGGLIGIIKNSPNAFPWLLLFGLNYLA